MARGGYRVAIVVYDPIRFVIWLVIVTLHDAEQKLITYNRRSFFVAQSCVGILKSSCSKRILRIGNILRVLGPGFGLFVGGFNDHDARSSRGRGMVRNVRLLYADRRAI